MRTKIEICQASVGINELPQRAGMAHDDVRELYGERQTRNKRLALRVAVTSQLSDQHLEESLARGKLPPASRPRPHFNQHRNQEKRGRENMADRAIKPRPKPVEKDPSRATLGGVFFVPQSPSKSRLRSGLKRGRDGSENTSEREPENGQENHAPGEQKREPDPAPESWSRKLTFWRAGAPATP
jgi:hypothetical protein